MAANRLQCKEDKPGRHRWQGQPKGKATQALALGPPEKVFAINICMLRLCIVGGCDPVVTLCVSMCEASCSNLHRSKMPPIFFPFLFTHSHKGPISELALGLSMSWAGPDCLRLCKSQSDRSIRIQRRILLIYFSFCSFVCVCVCVCGRLEVRREMEREQETTSLHSPLIVHNSSEVVDAKQINSDSTIGRSEVVEEVKKQLWLAGPLVSVTLLNFCLSVISVMYVGHLGELALSGASMATSFASVTGFSLLVGMASALDTFCGQSYGAKQYRMLGIHMQRAMLILMIVSIPLAVIWANTRSILIFLGQDPEISTEAGNYAKLMIPCIFGYGLLQCLNRFLQNQNIVFPMMLSSAVTTSLHLLICWFMVYKSGLGSSGAAVANSISYWLNVTILVLYVKFSPSCKKTWTGFSKEALQNIPTFVRLAVPSAVMVCLEMWSFELMVLLSGLLPNPKLETSVLSICLNTSAAAWMIPFGLSGAVSIRVSNELGAGHPWAARLAVRVVLVIAIIEGVLVGTLMMLVRNIWGYAYSNEVEVVKYVATMLPILAASNFLDGLQCVLSGTARGCGWQKIGAFVNLGSYYLVGIPAAVVLAFVLHIGGKGLWLGIICALIVQVLSLWIITIRTNWEQQAKKATDRVYSSATQESLVS